MSNNKKVVDIKKDESTANVDFNKLIELINGKIANVRETVPEEGREEYDDLIVNLYGVISIYDNWLKENDTEMNNLLNKLGKKPKKRSPIVLLS